MLCLPLALLLAQAKLPPEAERLAKTCADAFHAKNRAWFERHLAPGFVYKDLEGEKTDRTETLKKIERWFHPLGYRVGTSLTLVSAQKSRNGLLLVSELKVRAQLFGLRRMPLTETTVRVASLWRPQGKDWAAERIVEKSKRKTVDGKAVED